jgi:hypothetical protein
MTNISKSHKLFSEYLNNPRVLTNPEEFLGPNYEEVLNFWLILEELSEEQLRVVNERYWAFFDETRSEWRKATDLVCEASEKVVGWNYAHYASWAALVVTKSSAAYWATRELIGMHLILEQQPLTFFEMILEVL